MPSKNVTFDHFSSCEKQWYPLLRTFLLKLVRLWWKCFDITPPQKRHLKLALVRRQIFVSRLSSWYLHPWVRCFERWLYYYRYYYCQYLWVDPRNWYLNKYTFFTFIRGKWFTMVSVLLLDLIQDNLFSTVLVYTNRITRFVVWIQWLVIYCLKWMMKLINL